MNPMDHNNPMLNRNLSLPALLTYLFISLVSNVDASEFFERNGLAIEGYDPVAYFEEHKPVAGSAQYTTLYQGSRFQFASAANRDLFTAKPEKYAPQYGGFCAFGMAKGYKASIDPVAFTVVGGKLYLNYSETVRSRWLSDIPGYIRKADGNWPEVQRQTAVHQ